ncbi:LPXTG cell wall anchor domain-containing protein [Saccharothrix sp. ALI-22-I]|uniref:LPXTG cell wall anchor domain-containing protein n=1 Tax=Saccharothrix sp. ALI-22-I TaxID=1933778 RepID=UPI0009FE6869|nr:LPXTG cell wall anchor domain-containing protein [Saccharothrix sp. ALI-22-I]
MEFARIARRALGLSAVTVTAAVAVLAMTAPASAHVPELKAECKDDKAILSVKLRAYAGGNSNTIKIKDGDETLKDQKFGQSYEEKFTRPGDVAHVFTVTVKAGDGDQFSFTKKLKTPPCVTGTTTTTTSATTTTTSTTTTTTTVGTTTTTEPTTTTTTTTTTPIETTPTTTTTTTTSSLPTTTTTGIVPVSNESDLANTGASTAVPLVIGLVLLGAGGLALFMLRRRRTAE